MRKTRDRDRGQESAVVVECVVGGVAGAWLVVAERAIWVKSWPATTLAGSTGKGGGGERMGVGMGEAGGAVR
jgi:hypothetical protein